MYKKEPCVNSNIKLTEMSSRAAKAGSTDTRRGRIGSEGKYSEVKLNNDYIRYDW